MQQYDFTLIFAESLELTPDLADALYAAGCDDGTPGTANGMLFVGFHREAATLEDAICSAIEDVRRAGYAVARVEMEAGTMVRTG